jgi:hypothetical protein
MQKAVVGRSGEVNSCTSRSSSIDVKCISKSCNDVEQIETCPHRGPAEDCEASVPLPTAPQLEAATQDPTAGSCYIFEEGVHYPLIEGRLYFTEHTDEAYTMDRIGLDKFLFYFSSSIPGLYVFLTFPARILSFLIANISRQKHLHVGFLITPHEAIWQRPLLRTYKVLLLGSCGRFGRDSSKIIGQIYLYPYSKLTRHRTKKSLLKEALANMPPITITITITMTSKVPVVPNTRASAFDHAFHGSLFGTAYSQQQLTFPKCRQLRTFLRGLRAREHLYVRRILPVRSSGLTNADACVPTVLSEGIFV